MSDKFQGKYRISSTRLQNWDYGNNGAYFITICTKNREHYFGEIMLETSGNNQDNSPKMQLSQMGHLARQFWIEIPNRFPYIKLNAFVVMPNHVHGIIIIEKPGGDADGGDADGGDADGENCRDAINRVSTTTNGETPGGITNKKIPCYMIIYHALFVGIKVVWRLNHENYIPDLHGNPGFMIISSETKNRSYVSKNTLKPIR